MCGSCPDILLMGQGTYRHLHVRVRSVPESIKASSPPAEASMHEPGFLAQLLAGTVNRQTNQLRLHFKVAGAMKDDMSLPRHIRVSNSHYGTVGLRAWMIIKTDRSQTQTQLPVHVTQKTSKAAAYFVIRSLNSLQLVLSAFYPPSSLVLLFASLMTQAARQQRCQSSLLWGVE